ncbi:MAG TPA: hypothetical protein VFQ20_12595 [Burkholderiaceae bacterium]|nr:hypothetical protein [Burkholderiaceae bacterium]
MLTMPSLSESSLVKVSPEAPAPPVLDGLLGAPVDGDVLLGGELGGGGEICAIARPVPAASAAPTSSFSELLRMTYDLLQVA